VKNQQQQLDSAFAEINRAVSVLCRFGGNEAIQRVARARVEAANRVAVAGKPGVVKAGYQWHPDVERTITEACRVQKARWVANHRKISGPFNAPKFIVGGAK